ncbi:isopentenyl-diphosphate Delta-isomerase 1 [Schistocerca cancellata]|uniref:isopentenyl-diphosphate Delta-isomerase 1 n=1 Tax=Schistocerca cancellata TaxID=274614 RepID=UPI0021183F70|nr:isopentenyl-diphosphate Delta-isomerase 1 [Schistocerca cancellata]
MNTLKLFHTAAKICNRRYSTAVHLRHLNHVQERALEDKCILVDNSDRMVGSATKRDCHLVGKDGNLLLHRAFSVFIFNSNKELLLQKRSSHKITFPNCLTNACCSHPLHNIPGEREEDGAIGVRRAAQRRLNQELGIPPEQATLDDLHYLTRIHYKADTGIWGEHEIDYILILHKDVDVNPNPEEVSEISYVAREKFDEFMKSSVTPLTPWFHLIADKYLRLWWDNLNQLKQFQDHTTIHSFC